MARLSHSPSCPRVRELPHRHQLPPDSPRPDSVRRTLRIQVLTGLPSIRMGCRTMPERRRGWSRMVARRQLPAPCTTSRSTAVGNECSHRRKAPSLSPSFVAHAAYPALPLHIFVSFQAIERARAERGKKKRNRGTRAPLCGKGRANSEQQQSPTIHWRASHAARRAKSAL